MSVPAKFLSSISFEKYIYYTWIIFYGFGIYDKSMTSGAIKQVLHRALVLLGFAHHSIEYEYAVVQALNLVALPVWSFMV